MPPTLVKVGNLRPRMGEKQEVLDRMIPVDYIMNWFDKKLPRNSRDPPPKNLTMSDRVVILLAKTGSGKSGTIAPELYVRFNNRVRKQVIITQPRVLTAIDIPTNAISKIPSFKKPNKSGLFIELGRNMGFQTQEFERRIPKQGVLFVTTGILQQKLKMMSDEEFINKFKFIIIDEAHDRDVTVDIVLFMMKSLIERNLNNDPPFLILMSATLNVDEYSKYFNTKTIFEVVGQSKPIEVNYTQFDVPNVIEAIEDIVINKIHIENQSDFIKDGIVDYKSNTDIIIFIPGKKFITEITKALEKHNNSLKHKILILQLTSPDVNLATPDYQKLRYSLYGDYTRKVIIATNVAETGLTLENLRYCIDVGLNNSFEFNARYNVTMMLSGKPVTKSEALQRRGRVGREQDGVFYGLYTEDTFNNMTTDTTPGIYKTDITLNLLSIKIFNDESYVNMDINKIETTINKGSFNLEKLTMMSNPSDEMLSLALNKLFVMGALNSNKEVTEIGKLINQFKKLPIETCKMILSGLIYGANINDLIIIACCVQHGKDRIITDNRKYKVSIFKANSGSKIDFFKYNKLKYNLLVSCDFIEMLLIYSKFSKMVHENIEDIEKIKKWCEDMALNFYTMLAITEQVDEITKTMLFNMNIDIYKNKLPSLFDILVLSNYDSNAEFIEAIINIKKSIYEGYKMNLLVLTDNTSNPDKVGQCYQSITNHQYFDEYNYMLRELPNVSKGKKFEQLRPKYIITDSMRIKYNKALKCNEYKLGSYISVMDGFVNIDHTFLTS